MFCSSSFRHFDSITSVIPGKPRFSSLYRRTRSSSARCQRIGIFHTPLVLNERELRRMFGYSESYMAYDTCQFKDYDVYAANLFDKDWISRKQAPVAH